jgi:DNA-packaging protein gp3
MLEAAVEDSAPRARTREASSAKPVDAGRDRSAATGRFLPGNRAWEARCPAGPAPKFADAQTLWEACVDYFDWVADHPLHEMQVVAWRGRATQVPVPRMRAMTKTALCRFLSIAHTTWRAWKHDRPDLAETIERVEAVIYGWQFSGAAAGLLDAGLVIRQLGIGRKAGETKEDSCRTPAQVAGEAALGHSDSTPYGSPQPQGSRT